MPWPLSAGGPRRAARAGSRAGARPAPSARRGRLSFGQWRARGVSPRPPSHARPQLPWAARPRRVLSGCAAAATAAGGTGVFGPAYHGPPVRCEILPVRESESSSIAHTVESRIRHDRRSPRVSGSMTLNSNQEEGSMILNSNQEEAASADFQSMLQKQKSLPRQPQNPRQSISHSLSTKGARVGSRFSCLWHPANRAPGVCVGTWLHGLRRRTRGDGAGRREGDVAAP